MTGATLAACGEVRGPETQRAADQAPRFEGSAPTLELLGEGLLDALARSNTGAMATLRLTEREHNDIVWPELPASDPKVNFPVDYAWQNIETRNLRAVKRILPLYADRDLDFRRVECRGMTQEFETFRVHTDCWVVFESGDGTAWEAQIFKDVLERGGGYKIFRYYDDEEPQPYHGSATLP